MEDVTAVEPPPAALSPGNVASKLVPTSPSANGKQSNSGSGSSSSVAHTTADDAAAGCCCKQGGRESVVVQENPVEGPLKVMGSLLSIEE